MALSATWLHTGCSTVLSLRLSRVFLRLAREASLCGLQGKFILTGHNSPQELCSWPAEAACSCSEQDPARSGLVWNSLFE